MGVCDVVKKVFISILILIGLCFIGYVTINRCSPVVPGLQPSNKQVDTIKQINRDSSAEIKRAGQENKRSEDLNRRSGELNTEISTDNKQIGELLEESRHQVGDALEILMVARSRALGTPGGDSGGAGVAPSK